jgi:hypothetical protein
MLSLLCPRSCVVGGFVYHDAFFFDVAVVHAAFVIFRVAALQVLSYYRNVLSYLHLPVASPHLPLNRCCCGSITAD